MPRALSIASRRVAPDSRDDVRRTAAAARDHWASAGCSYWLFEDDSAPGSFLEFVEAPDAHTLRRALQDLPGPGQLPATLYTEVTLS